MLRTLALSLFAAVAMAAPQSQFARGSKPTAPTLEDHDIAQPASRPAPPVRELLTDSGDLDAIKKRGVLRVLIFGDVDPYLPRTDGSSAADYLLAEDFAISQKLAFEPIAVARFEDLIPMLLAGKGDLIAARMTVTEARQKQIAFTRPTSVVQELLVAKSGPLPVSNLSELIAWSARSPSNAVTVRPSSSYRETLNSLKVRVALSSEDIDESDLVRKVVAGKIPFTACDSDLFADIAAFMPEAIAAPFPLAEGRQVALGVRPANPQLKAAADAFLIQHALTGHKQDTDVGDLDAVKQRGSIRVLLRNNATNYFIYRGVQQGFEYELLKAYAKDNGLRIDVIVPFENGDVIPWLRAGRGDVAATEMTVTDERRAQLAFTQPYMSVDEVLIQKTGAPPIKTLDQLKAAVASGALALRVRRSSSYATTLDALGIAHVDAPEEVETEQLISQVARGETAATIADSSIAAVETRAHQGAQATLVLKKKNPIALGVRSENPQLLKSLDAFLKKSARNGTTERLRRKYFAARPGSNAGQVDIRVTGVLSPFDPQIKKWAQVYGLDWRLLAAQAYQESAFDPKAESWCGAQGLFQVMPKTGRALGFADVRKPEHNIQAGIKYMAQLIDELDPRLPFKQRVRFALASYNAGPHHLADARALAAELGLDPDKWFGNVEQAMLLLEQHKYARRAKHGWCRGSEPVGYVSSIQSRYDNWTAVLPDDTAPKKQR